MPLIIAISNLKGGVAKSSTTVFLGECLALNHKQRVLIIDLDPQANASFMLLSREGVNTVHQTQRTLAHFIMALYGNGLQPLLSDYVHGNASDLSELDADAIGRLALVSSIPRLWFVESTFDKQFYQRSQSPDQELSRALICGISEVSAHFDVVLIDCPPGFSSLTRAGILSSHVIISPTIADAISSRSLHDFAEIGLKEILKMREPKHFVVISKFIKNDTTLQEKELLKSQYNVIDPTIPYSVRMPRAMLRVRPDSYRTFAEKYGALRSDVTTLTAKVYNLIIEKNLTHER